MSGSVEHSGSMTRRRLPMLIASALLLVASVSGSASDMGNSTALGSKPGVGVGSNPVRPGSKPSVAGGSIVVALGSKPGVGSGSNVVS